MNIVMLCTCLLECLEIPTGDFAGVLSRRHQWLTLTWNWTLAIQMTVESSHWLHSWVRPTEILCGCLVRLIELRNYHRWRCSTFIISSVQFNYFSQRKKVIFLGLSVCTLDFSEKLWTDFGDIWRVGTWPKDHVIRFWWRSGSRSWQRFVLSQLFEFTILQCMFKMSDIWLIAA